MFYRESFQLCNPVKSMWCQGKNKTINLPKDIYDLSGKNDKSLWKNS